jgi:hypothetical protein
VCEQSLTLSSASMGSSRRHLLWGCVMTGLDTLPPDVSVTLSTIGRAILEDRGGIRTGASPSEGAGSSPEEPSIPVGFGRLL